MDTPDKPADDDQAADTASDDQPQGTRQETADSSKLGKKPTSTPADSGPKRPGRSKYAS